MFIIYLTNDQLLTDELVRISNQVLSEYLPSTYEEEVDFYNVKEQPGVEARVDGDSINLDKSRQERRRTADAIQPKRDRPVEFAELDLTTGNSGYSDRLPLGSKLEYASNCIEILGQILRNFTGSLPGNQKLAILKATCLLGLRMARALLAQMAQASAYARQSFEGADPAKRNRETEKQVERLLTIIAQMLGLLAINKISTSIGSPEIEKDAYDATIDTVGRNPATELLNLAIRLDHAGQDEYPFGLIKGLKSKFSNNLYAQRLLSDLVVGNMQVFEIGREMRQRVLATLGIKAPDEAILSRSNKRLR